MTDFLFCRNSKLFLITRKHTFRTKNTPVKAGISVPTRKDTPESIGTYVRIKKVSSAESKHFSQRGKTCRRSLNIFLNGKRRVGERWNVCSTPGEFIALKKFVHKSLKMMP
jgi:hypothetical protein